MILDPDHTPRAVGSTGLRKIVVGVTNDTAARDALRWALHVANLEGALLEVVTACKPPRAVLTTYGWAYFDVRDAEAAARFVQHNLLAAEPAGRGAVRIRRVIARGEPVAVLLATARDADLLVVGRRPSRLRRLATGSVSKACANHADCPVVIVRSDLPAAHVPVPTWNRSSPAGPFARAPVHHERRHARIELRRGH